MADPNQLLHFFTSYLGVNPAVGCPNRCGYCVLEKDVANPSKIIKKASPKFTLETLLKDKRVIKRNALSFYNLSDPFLKDNLKDLLYILEGLDAQGQKNLTVLITKLNPDRTAPKEKALERIAKLKNLRPVLMVSYTNLPKKIEPLSKSGRLELLQKAQDLDIPVLQYVRPLWEKWTPQDKIQEMAEETANLVTGVVLGGILTTEEIKKKLSKRKVPVPPWGNSKGRYLNSDYRSLVIKAYKNINPQLPLFLNSSCGLSHALKVPHYMGFYSHFSRMDPHGFCQRPCHPQQKERCATARPYIKKTKDPQIMEREKTKIKEWLKQFGIRKAMFQIEEGYLNLFARLNEQETRMMRQHTGMFIYSAYNFKTFRNQPRLF